MDAKSYGLAIGEMLTGSIAESVSRTLDMGEMTFRSSDNDVVSVHIQCPYRVLADGIVVLGSADVRFSDLADRQEAFQGYMTVFDTRAKALTGVFANMAPKVLGVDMADAGAFTARMSGGISLEVFPDCSGSVEAWRAFSRDRSGSYGYPPETL